MAVSPMPIDMEDRMYQQPQMVQDLAAVLAAVKQRRAA
jgi:hypothetical protein